MAKGAQQNREHQAAVQLFGKTVSKRAGFRCEWCEGDQELRLWEYQPDREPGEENLALLCSSCRELVGTKNPDPRRLRSLRNALWSQIPAVAEGAAVVLARCKEPWVREAIEESFIDEGMKERLL
ncbi:hypothetical protein KOM00_06355 [Geomonas sp. Red69]|uniref:HNH endonuclease n=1 Tax=Geomonas diazotrophica TaxID=2843197 RepID=A0ABX8JUQ7_9BACT|nr:MULTISPECIES: hypothetical protein [Geomonas]MBU5636353.1 hypothetical protein [Geomonas diazotrophica]QWV99150.1 hypothetical protein KP005_07695 [Geomonas nitrogeniifigens]QXE88318.1 hypothetical protein KP003_07950 [Geomonas nitrogeniifigens]